MSVQTYQLLLAVTHVSERKTKSYHWCKLVPCPEDRILVCKRVTVTQVAAQKYNSIQ